MKILVTGAAGFIGFHLAVKFANQGNDVVGIDNRKNTIQISKQYLK